MIKVLKPGFYSSIQDLGRKGFQHYGVPVSGAMDGLAVELANTLLGNSKESAVIEMTMTGANLEFMSHTLICLSGANMNPTLNKTPIQVNKVIEVCPGDILSFGGLKHGFRCYLAVLGGIKTTEIMQSRSMYKGVTDAFILKKGDVLKIENQTFNKIKQYASVRFDSSYIDTHIVEVFKGPEFDLLAEEQKAQLQTMRFQVSKDNNRMAYQLFPKIENQLESIITSLVLPGTVQLTPFGTLIVLMKDCQTTGGYPRVLQLTEKAGYVLSQKRTGQSFHFRFIDI